jgi:hypothetical protein
MKTSIQNRDELFLEPFQQLPWSLNLSMINFLGFVGTGPHAHPTHKVQKSFTNPYCPPIIKRDATL